MKKENLFINATPIAVYGEKSDKVFLYVHGQGGNKQEAERFAEICAKYSYQVLSVDLPEHGGRIDKARFLPQDVCPELCAVIHYAQEHWRHISLRAVSIGAWFSMLAFTGTEIKQCIFSSPLLDMENMINNMMAAAGVTKERLEKEKVIKTDFGSDLSWDYLCYVKSHPVCAVCENTAILYASGDELIPRFTVDEFVKNNACRLTVFDGGEHWLHTPNQLERMAKWEKLCLENAVLPDII